MAVNSLVRGAINSTVAVWCSPAARLRPEAAAPVAFALLARLQAPPPTSQRRGMAYMSARLRPEVAAPVAFALLARLQVPPPTCQRRGMAYMPKIGPQKWPRYNQQVFEPTAPNEAERPAFVCHALTHVKYSRKKMWYVASMIRGMSVHEALKQLQFVNLKGAKIASQAIREAQEMAVRDHNVEFKNNLWVAESFATKARVVKGLRRHARGRMCFIKYGYIHYFLRLEEGAPPAQYYLDAPKPPEQLLQQWLDRRRDRTILHSL